MLHQRHVTLNVACALSQWYTEVSVFRLVQMTLCVMTSLVSCLLSNQTLFQMVKQTGCSPLLYITDRIAAKAKAGQKWRNSDLSMSCMWDQVKAPDRGYRHARFKHKPLPCHKHACYMCVASFPVYSVTGYNVLLTRQIYAIWPETTVFHVWLFSIQNGFLIDISYQFGQPIFLNGNKSQFGLTELNHLF